MTLGCGGWSAEVRTRGGEELLGVLKPSTLSMGRTLNDVSIGSLSAPGCDPCIAIRPWRHEVHLVRDGVVEWMSIPFDPSSTQDSIDIEMRDLGAWLDHRLLNSSLEFVEEDFATILRFLFSSAVERENSMNLVLSVEETGVTLSRLFSQKDRRNAGEEIRDLASAGLDFTFHLRELIAYKPDMPTPIGILTDDVLNDRRISVVGGPSATEATVLGATDSIEGIAGGVSEVDGLVQAVLTSQSRVLDNAAAEELAQQVIRGSESPALRLDATLLPDAPFEFRQLIPGTAFLVYATTQCESIEGIPMRLTNMGAQITAEAPESVSVTLVSE